LNYGDKVIYYKSFASNTKVISINELFLLVIF